MASMLICTMTVSASIAGDRAADVVRTFRTNFTATDVGAVKGRAGTSGDRNAKEDVPEDEVARAPGGPRSKTGE